MAKSKFNIGDIGLKVFKLGDDNVKLYLGDMLSYPIYDPIGEAVVTCDSAIYNGSNQIAQNITVTLNGVTLTENTDYTVTQNAGGTNAGSYTVLVTGTGDFSGTSSGTFIINKVTPTVTAPVAKSGLVYSGSPQALATSGSTNWGTIQYSTSENGTYTSAMISGTNATSYEVWYKVIGDSNINDVAPSKISVSIAKADPTYVAPSAKTLTYNTSAQELITAGSVTGGTIQYSSDNSTWSSTIPSATDVGKYTSYWRIVGDSNHNDKSSSSIETTISPKVPDSPTITLNPSAYTFDGTAHQPSPTVKDGSTTIPSSEYTVSYSNNVSAGTATCTITDKSGGNYTVNGSKTFTINKVTPTVTAPTPKTLTYNTSAQTLANAGSTNWGTMMYCLGSSGGTYSTSVPSATNANVTYEIWYKVSGDSNVNDFGPVKMSPDATIAEKRVTTPTITLSPSSYTYSNSDCKPTPTVKDGSTVIPSSEYTVTYSNNKNAGTATVTISDNTAGNYYISGTTTFTINKASCHITTAPTAKSLTYNGAAQALINSDGAGSGTLLYKLGSSGTYGTSIPTATNAGNYTVYYKASASTNYNEGCESTVSCSIAQKAITCTAPTAKSLTYTGSAQALINAGSVVGGSMTYSTASTGTYSSSIPSGTSAGNYTVYWKGAPDSSGNYSGSCSGSIGITIAKCTPVLSTSPTYVSNWTYDATAHNLLTGGAMKRSSSDSTAVAGTFTYDQGTNVGTYSNKKWYFTPTDTTNYNSTNGIVTGSVTCNCKSCTAPTAKSLTYNNSAQALVNGGSTSYGTMVYSTSQSGTYSTTIPTGTNAGSYEVWRKVTGDTNVCCTAATKISCSIACKSCTAPTAKSLTYTGSAQALVTAGSTSYGTMVYSTSQSGTYSTTIPTGTNAGSYEVWWKVTGNTNVCCTAATKISCSIAKGKFSPVPPKAAVRTYNGSAQQIVSGGSAPGGSIYYSSASTGTGSATTVPTQTNAGTYTTYWRAILTDTTNYSGSSTSWSAVTNCTINKAAITCCTPTAKSLTWTGSAQALVNGCTPTGGSMTYCTTSGGTYSSTIPTGTNAGTYTTWYKCSPDSNHSGSSSGSVSTTIAKAAMTCCTPTAKSGLVYNGNAQAIVNDCTPTGGDIYYATSNAGASSSTTVPTKTDAGSYTIYYRCLPDGNHSGGTSSWAAISCSIAKKNVVCTAPTAKSLTYTGSAQALANAGSCAGGTIQYCSTSGGTYSTTIPTGTNAGSYTVWYKCSATATTNYSGTCSGSVSCSIAKKAFSYVAPKAAVRTYNGSAQQIVSGQSATGGAIYFSTASTGTGSATTVPTATNTGTSYSTYWRAVLTDTTNYSGSSTSWSAVTNCTINKATLTITAKAQTVNYGTAITTGTGQVTTTGLVNGDSLTSITLTTSTSNVPGGLITPSAGATTKGIGNYSVTYKAGQLTINKVAMTYTAPSAATRTYNYSAQQIVSGQSAAGGNIQYCSTSGGTYSTTVPTQTNVGTYSTWWKAVPDGNHSGGTSAAQITNCKINCKSCSAPTAKSLTYNGSAQALVYAGSTSYGTMVYCLNNSGGTYSTTVPTATNAGSYTVWWKASGNTNVCCTSPASVSCSIACKPCTAPKAKSLTYNGSAQALVDAGSTSYGTMVYCLNNSGGTYSTTVPTATNAGTYTVWWKVTGNTNVCCTSPSAVSSSIKKVAMTYVAPKAATNTYNGSSKQIVSGASATGGAIYYSTDSSGSNSSTTVPTKITAGTYSTYWKAVPDGNHSGGTSSWAQITGCTINKASRTLTVSGSNVAGIGSNATTTLVATLSAGKGDGAITFSSNSTSIATVNSSTGVVTGVNTGSCTITVNVAAGTNYLGVSGSTSIRVINNNSVPCVSIGNLLWATKNVGASSVTDYGQYFEWGSTAGYASSSIGTGSNKKPFNQSDYKFNYDTGTTATATAMTKYNASDSKTVLDACDDAARLSLGGAWRVPTLNDIAALSANTNVTWTSNFNSSGIAGLLLTSKANSSTTLFLPAGGLSLGSGAVSYTGQRCFYWTSTLNSDKTKAYDIENPATSTAVVWNDYSGRSRGMLIRGVIG